MKTNILHGILIMAATTWTTILLTGCDIIGPSVKGSGDIAGETREVPSFTGVLINGSADMTVTYGTTQSVKVTTDDNILPIITTEVSNGVLKIDSKESYSTSYGVRVEITIPKLESIEIQGSGDVSVEGGQLENTPLANFRILIDGSGDVKVSGLNATNVSAEIEGSGDILLGGNCGTFTANLDGSGDITADEFRTMNATASLNGSGDIRVYATEVLNATISGSGDIHYRGNPKTVNKSISGSGDLIRLP